MRFEPAPDQQCQVDRNLLMSDVRRRRHVVLSVDQLVPLPVVGEEHEVVVGELQTRAGWFHVIAPGHRLIVAVRGAPTVPRAEPSISGGINQTFSTGWKRFRCSLGLHVAESAAAAWLDTTIEESV
jgi:hypothetical protein